MYSLIILIKNEDKVKFSTKKIFFLITIVLFVGCSNLPTPPNGTIEVDKMAQILADIHLTEAKLSKLSFQNYDSSKVAYRELERRLFKKHSVDSLTYRKSFDFYTTQPEYMVKIYEKVDKVLEEKKKKKQLD